MTSPSAGKSVFLGLGGGNFVGTGLFTAASYRLVEREIKRLREAREPIPDWLKHMHKVLQPEAAAVLLSPLGQRDAAPSTDLPVSPHELIDTRKAGAILQVHPRTVRRWYRKLGGRKVGGRWVFDPMIVAAMARGEQTAA